MHICLIYDCLYPYTVGGAERWYRNLAEELARAGHRVTYLTLRQWEKSDHGQVPGVEVVAVGPSLALYGAGGQRRILPPLVFGLGVLLHLLWKGRRYDVVHTASFPYFSLLAAALLRPLWRYRLVVDWHEFWSESYWKRYLGGVGGWIGWAVQSLCLRVPQHAFCFARLTAARLAAHGLRGEVEVLEGEYWGATEPRALRPAEPVMLFAGRHIAEKRPVAVVEAFAVAKRSLPDLRCVMLGRGPESDAVRTAIAAHGLADLVDAPGFVPAERVEVEMSRALCLVHPSSREGYGLVVVEAAAHGTPVILVRGEDNAATELVEDGVNGYVVDNASAECLADAVIRIQRDGDALRQSSVAWFARNAHRLSIGASVARVVGRYAVGGAGKPAA
jgi:glycosyltransferase involved in cell wall biosynthesis